ncbi:Holliday junction branch migration protein RuvA [Thioalkalivibrio sulfidiphilus]|uniref:Holliday junction branch migration complex subunit RuvA n=1 Tax=Thioalkalivibrio sulfidiphilus (strain HL-EbGR7) TaxID=396588 RepID=RUVA_THISH|nr:Holliday junction branch migration protein RuvA [Thioalkalivibrio sulfidiphilus]B8GUJ5.1 RecName: Full=Holliday junction branch migration complex subunit RuvA [Thioalkalivibrio sulfidiphilus HL-EbGr7]ACL73315.1 DNA recombination protein, RuvA [Thioalkalivibrio sulfidiphilus HL-EbGr7]
MIGRLRGELVSKQPPFLLLDVQGVGYEIEAPLSTFYDLPEPGGQVTLHTHLHVREDAHVLYGFASESERALFRSLIKVTGVGAKMALAILSGMTASEFSRCVMDGDVASLVRLPGIGRKTAERLVVEMRDRLGSLPAAVTLTGGKPAAAAARAPDPVSDAVSALVSLGYKPQEASRLISAVEGEAERSEDLIRLALKATLK